MHSFECSALNLLPPLVPAIFMGPKFHNVVIFFWNTLPVIGEMMVFRDRLMYLLFDTCVNCGASKGKDCSQALTSSFEF